MYWRLSPFNSSLYQLVLIKEHKSTLVLRFIPGSMVCTRYKVRCRRFMTFYRYFLRTLLYVCQLDLIMSYWLPMMCSIRRISLIQCPWIIIFFSEGLDVRFSSG